MIILGLDFLKTLTKYAKKNLIVVVVKTIITLLIITTNYNQSLSSPISPKDCCVGSCVSCSCLMGAAATLAGCVLGDYGLAGAAAAVTTCTTSSSIAAQTSPCCSENTQKCFQASVVGANVCSCLWSATGAAATSTFLPAKLITYSGLLGGCIGATCGCATGACLYCCYKCKSHNTNNQASTSSEEKAENGVVTTQPERLVVSSMETVLLSPEMNPQAQLSSLYAVQSIISPLSDQILSLVKSLPINIEYKNSKKETSLNFNGYLKSVARDTMKKLYTVELIQNFSEYEKKLSLTSLDKQYSNPLKKKAYSAQTGINIHFLQHTNFLIMHDAYVKNSQNFSGMHILNSKGSATASTQVNTILTGLGFNTSSPGLSLYMSTCNGLGKIKAQRELNYMNTSSKYKGTSDVMVYGNFIRLGYNFFITHQSVIIPYVTYAMSSVSLKKYREKYGLLPYKISQNKEHIKEKSFGIFSSFQIQEKLSLKGWSAVSFIKRTSKKLYTKPLNSHMHEYFIPENKKSYTSLEFGISGNIQCTERLTLNVSNTFTQRLTNKKNTVLFSFNMHLLN